jgi:hypothetical protein
VQTLKEIFLKEIEDMFPAVMQQFAGNLEGQVNFQKILAGKIADISVHQVKRALTPVTDYYALCTAAIGLAIGIVNVGIFLIL